MKTIRQHHISFKHAIDGLTWAFSTQPNFSVHLYISTIVLVLSLILRVSEFEFLILLLTIILGLAVELVNTAIEAVTDLVSPDWHEQAKTAKDVAAGMMLFTALGAVLIGSIIFVPKLIVIFQLI